MSITVESFEELLIPSLKVELENIKKEYESKYVEADIDNIHELVKRSDFPVMHIKQGKKKRTCQNMNGVLGGSNAFNFLSFVAGVITLVSLFFALIKINITSNNMQIVNVNNNVNNNNNNLNGVNGNANNNQNNNANVNNNAANIILTMPGRKKRETDSCEDFNLATALFESMQVCKQSIF